MIDYSRWTSDELALAKALIEAELSKRCGIFRIVEDPTMPAGAFEVHSGPHRIRVTNVGDGDSQP